MRRQQLLVSGISFKTIVQCLSHWKVWATASEHYLAVQLIECERGFSLMNIISTPLICIQPFWLKILLAWCLLTYMAPLKTMESPWLCQIVAHRSAVDNKSKNCTNVILLNKTIDIVCGKCCECQSVFLLLLSLSGSGEQCIWIDLLQNSLWILQSYCH